MTATSEYLFYSILNAVQFVACPIDITKGSTCYQCQLLMVSQIATATYNNTVMQQHRSASALAYMSCSSAAVGMHTKPDEIYAAVMC
jgi:hypothetical protein